MEPIDVAIPNAGHGHEGVFEESTMTELRAHFEVNVFGAVATVKAVLTLIRSTDFPDGAQLPG